MNQQVWTFVVCGGQTLRLSLANNPALDHDGTRTLWKLVGDATMAMQAENALRAFGCSVRCYTETESPEQQAERAYLTTGVKPTQMKAKWTEELATDLHNFHRIKQT